MRIDAPFTAEQVVQLMAWQKNPKVHPFTCANRDLGHPVIDGEHGALVPTVDGWICPFCRYRQAWAHDFMVGLVGS